MGRLRTHNRRALKKRYRPYVWSSARVALRAWFRHQDHMREVFRRRLVTEFMLAAYVEPMKSSDGA